jgi:hypothetical protein
MTGTASTTTRAQEIQSPIEWVERATVLTAARLADHPWVVPAADVALRCQAFAWRTFRRATTFVLHSYGMTTYDEFGLLGEQLSAIRHRLPPRSASEAS